jgi:hypothetical protein
MNMDRARLAAACLSMQPTSQLIHISSPAQVKTPSLATKLVTVLSNLHRPAQVRDSVRHVDAKLVELSNGCICCTLRDDLLTSVADIVAAQRFDYLVIESTGGPTVACIA